MFFGWDFSIRNVSIEMVIVSFQEWSNSRCEYLVIYFFLSQPFWGIFALCRNCLDIGPIFSSMALALG